MTNRKNRQPKDRMIHIRLDEATHKRLKIEAVYRDTTVQNLVEELILKNIVGPQAKEQDNGRSR